MGTAKEKLHITDCEDILSWSRIERTSKRDSPVRAASVHLILQDRHDLPQQIPERPRATIKLAPCVAVPWETDRALQGSTRVMWGNDVPPPKQTSTVKSMFDKKGRLIPTILSELPLYVLMSLRLEG